nr:glycoside hydrolase family 19 protein [Rhodopseudomonas sp. BR0C11]
MGDAVSDFGRVLNKLWPKGDQKIPGLRAGMIATAGAVFARFDATSPQVVAHIMAQISHECGTGRDVVENLNYTAGRMVQIWPSRFKTLEAAKPYAGNPQALANKVYNGRMGNRPGSDDGWNFRGRGGSQTTGREGYERLAKLTGLDVVNNPDLVLDPQHFLLCAVADFVACGCMPFAKADDVVGVTRRLNGGAIGLAERRAWLAQWKAALGAEPVVFARAAAPVVADPSPAPAAGPPTPDPSPQGGGEVTADVAVTTAPSAPPSRGPLGTLIVGALKFFNHKQG